MSIFVDTSGFYAAADRSDRHHEGAAAAFREAVTSGKGLVTHSMVVTETAALMQRRLGHKVALAFLHSLPGFEVIWVDQELLHAAVARFSEARPADLSLVDCVSFTAMRRYGLKHYLGIDAHFDKEGFLRVQA